MHQKDAEIPINGRAPDLDTDIYFVLAPDPATDDCPFSSIRADRQASARLDLS